MLEKKITLSSDMKTINRPIIGYMGFIKRHIDLKLLHSISIEKPNWSIVLVGPIKKKSS